MDPNKQEILVEYIEHRVQAMRQSQLWRMSPDAVKQVRVYINIADVKPWLVLINIFNLLLVKYGLPLVDPQVFFDLVLLLFFYELIVLTFLA